MPDKLSDLDLVKRRRVLQSLGLAGAGVLAGCTTNTDEDNTESPEDDTETEDDSTPTEDDQGAQQERNELRLAQVKGPLEFDPIVLNDVPSAQVVLHVFEGLYTYNEGTEIVPQIASGEPTVEENGERYVVEIVDNATFHNGDPVTVEDIKYSFEAPVAEETSNAAEYDMIDTVEVVDDTTLAFNLNFPFGAFDNVLASSIIVPQSVRENDKEAFNKENPVGSGPFVFDGWQEGQFARIVRNDNYWGDVTPNLPAVRFVPVEEPTTRVTSLRTGENDVIEEIPPRLYPQVEGMEDASIEEVLGIGYFYLAFNCNEGPTTDPKVREAVDYCFSMDQAVANFVEPSGERQYSPLPRPVADDWEFPVDEWQQIPHDKDIDQATQLFEEAGVADDWNPRIIVPPDDKREQIGVTVANGLNEAGFDANVQRLDWGAFLDQYISGSADDYNMYTLGWAGTPDPDSFTYYLLAQEVEGVTNGTFHTYDEASQQIADARASADQEERFELYNSAITTLLEGRVHLPAYNLKNGFAVKNYVQDFHAHPVNSFSLVSDYNNVSMQ